jgi:hypothetical protein
MERRRSRVHVQRHYRGKRQQMGSRSATSRRAAGNQVNAGRRRHPQEAVAKLAAFDPRTGHRPNISIIQLKVDRGDLFGNVMRADQFSGTCSGPPSQPVDPSRA